MTDLSSLISHLESSTEGSRELDCEVALAVGYDHEVPADRFLRPSLFSRVMPILLEQRPEVVRRMADVYRVPRYTASLDAIIDTIDPAHWVKIGHRRAHGNHGPRECFAGYEVREAPFWFGSAVATFPLALCAARVKEAQYRADHTGKEG
jgi:hypothetical protein